MKKSLLLVLAVLFGVSTPITAQSSANGYVPLVVEGAKWECDFVTTFHDLRPEWIIPYAIELKGDTIIDDIVYKCCVYTFKESSWKWEDISYNSPAETLTLAFIREDVENRKVYARFNELQGHSVYGQLSHYQESNGEFLLYDFGNINNSEQIWQKSNSLQGPLEFTASKITIDGVERNCYAIGQNGVYGYIVEGIGYDGYGFNQNAGDLMCQFPLFVNGTDNLPVFKTHKKQSGKAIYNTGDATNAFNGVKNIEADSNATEVARYDVHGRKLAEPTKGINIVKMSDGTARKVFVK